MSVYVPMFANWQTSYTSLEVCRGVQPRQCDAPVYISWSFPPLGFIKINTDGSFIPNSGLAGYGGILRDDHGRWLAGFCGRLSMVATSCLTAELWAIHAGLTLAKKHNLKNVIIETDSIDALNMLLSIGEVDVIIDSHHLDRPVIEECRSLVFELRITLMHTMRQGNNCADHLAKLGRMQQHEDPVILRCPPRSLHQLLLADMTHVAYPRYPKHIR